MLYSCAITPAEVVFRVLCVNRDQTGSSMQSFGSLSHLSGHYRLVSKFKNFIILSVHFVQLVVLRAFPDFEFRDHSWQTRDHKVLIKFKLK